MNNKSIFVEEKNRAMQLAQTNKADEAVKIFESLYADNNTDEELICMLGITYLQLSKLSDSRHYFECLIELSNNNIMGYYYLAEISHTEKKYTESLELYLKALKLGPVLNQKAGILFKIAGVEAILGNDAGAIKCYNELMLLQPDNADIYFYLGVFSKKSGDIDKAIKYHNKSLGLNENHLGSLIELGGILLESADYNNAEILYRKALLVSPENYEVMMNLGHVLGRKNELEETVQLYTAVSKIKPDFITVWERLGATYRKMKKQTQSVKCYKKALKLDPDNESIQFKLATTGDYDISKFKAPPESFVTDLFDGYADKFDQHLVKKLGYQTPSKIFSHLEVFLSKTDNQLKVLDLGCGTGLCGKLFSKYKSFMLGVDLSSKMIDKARLLGCYDELVVGDVLPPLEQYNDHYDIVLSADVFVYIGDLGSIFIAASKSLVKNGLFAFSIEAADGDGFVLRESGRYAHSIAYIRSLASSCGFDELVCDEVILRKENEKEMHGYIVVLKRTK